MSDNGNGLAALIAGAVIIGGFIVYGSMTAGGGRPSSHAERIGAQIAEDNAASRPAWREDPRALQRRAAAESRDAPPPPPRDDWRKSVGRSAMDDSPSVTLSTQSVRPIELSFGRQYPVTLFIRCLENRTALLVSIEDAFIDTESVRVTYRIDSRPAQSATWRVSTSFDAFGLWSGNQSIPLVRQLEQADRLRVQFTPYGEDTVTVTFRLSGLDQHLPELRAACNW